MQDEKDYNSIPDRPVDWTPDRSIHSNMTDLAGTRWTQPKYDYAEAWESVKRGLNKGYGGGSGDTGNKLSDHNETILKQREDEY